MGNARRTLSRLCYAAAPSTRFFFTTGLEALVVNQTPAAIPLDAQPRLPHGVRLVQNEAHGGWVLLAPERVFKADAIAVEIIKRCTGDASLAEIVDETGSTTPPRPLGLLAELTHRCPLGCPYCSNPLALDTRDGELAAATWARVFREAAGLGVLQVHLSGGEPGARRDLVDIMAAARDAGLYTNLITSAVGVTAKSLAALAD